MATQTTDISFGKLERIVLKKFVACTEHKLRSLLNLIEIAESAFTQEKPPVKATREEIVRVLNSIITKQNAQLLTLKQICLASPEAHRPDVLFEININAVLRFLNTRSEYK